MPTLDEVLDAEGMNEETPMAVAELGTAGTYGSRLARCEDALLETLGCDTALIIRPGYI